MTNAEQIYACCEKPDVPMSRPTQTQCIEYNPNLTRWVKTFKKKQDALKKETAKNTPTDNDDDMCAEEKKRQSPEFDMLLRENAIKPLPTALTTAETVDIEPPQPETSDPTAMDKINPQLAKHMRDCMDSENMMNEIYEIDFVHNNDPLLAARNAIEMIDLTDFTKILQILIDGGTLNAAQLQYLVYFTEAAAELSPHKLATFFSCPLLGAVMQEPVRHYLEDLLSQKDCKLTPMQLRMFTDSFKWANECHQIKRARALEQQKKPVEIKCPSAQDPVEFYVDAKVPDTRVLDDENKATNQNQKTGNDEKTKSPAGGGSKANKC